MSETEQRRTLGGRVRPFTVPVTPTPPARPMKSPERAAVPTAPETKRKPIEG